MQIDSNAKIHGQRYKKITKDVKCLLGISLLTRVIWQKYRIMRTSVIRPLRYNQYNSYTYMSDFSIYRGLLKNLAIGIITTITCSWAYATADLPTFEEVAAVRAKADEHRFKIYVLDKLEVHSYAQVKNGLCLDFIGSSDGLYRSRFSGGPIMVDLANCGEEDHFIDGRIKALKLLEAREHRDGLTKDQIDHAIEEINAIFDGKKYSPEIKE